MMRILISLLICSIFFSCSDETLSTEDTRLGLEYYPLEVGQFRIYDVEEILYSISSFDTLVYELRERVSDSFVNTEGSVSFVITRERRFEGETVWSVDSIWTARKSANQIVSVENNISIVKMVFPIEDDLSWDSNVLNSSTEQLFRYELDIENITILEQEFTDPVMVIQSEVDGNLVRRDERTEVYAPDIGLIDKQSVVLEFCTSGNCEEQSITSGRALDQTIKSYGIE